MDSFNLTPEESSKYSSFAHSVNNFQLLSHLNTLSQLQPLNCASQIPEKYLDHLPVALPSSRWLYDSKLKSLKHDLNQDTDSVTQSDILTSPHLSQDVNSNVPNSGDHIERSASQLHPIQGSWCDTSEDLDWSFLSANAHGIEAATKTCPSHSNIESMVEVSPRQRSTDATVIPSAVGTDALIDSSFDGSLHKFGDYKRYFENKRRKQHLADDEYVARDAQMRGSEEPAPLPVFQGCRIYVNGLTVPSINEIHRLVILHGGTFLAYLNDKGTATHIICDLLTPKKMKEFRNYKVVKAQWIVDSVLSSVLQDWQAYRLIGEIEYGQARLHYAAFQKKSSHTYERNGPCDSRPPGPSVLLEPSHCTRDIPISPSRDVSQSLLLSPLFASESNLLYINPNFAPEIMSNGLELHSRERKPSLVASNEANKRPRIVEEGLTLEQRTELVSSSSDLIYKPDINSLEKPNQTEDNQLATSTVNQSRFRAMDAKHPDFLQHYFANSRLHQLSTWKADLRNKFRRNLVRDRKAKHSALPELLQSERVILHIDIDCFFAAASCLRHSQYNINSNPIAITHGTKLSDIASCNYPARNKGVRNGMWVVTARSLCPELVLLDYDFDTYEQLSGKFFNYLETYTSFDSIVPVLIDEVLIDATSQFRGNRDQRSESVAALCKQIRQDIFLLTKISVSIGASKNILLAKLALKKAKPDNLFVLFDNYNDFLADIPVKDFPGVGRHICDKIVSLTKTNPARVCDVLQICKPVLLSVLGEKTGAKIWNYSRGIDDTEVALDLDDPEAVFGRKSVSVDINYGIRFDSVAQLDDFLMRLAKELHNRLLNLGICGLKLCLRLVRRAKGAPIVPEKHMGFGIVDFVSKSSRLGVATNDWGVIGSEMKALYRMLNIPILDLRGIAVTLSRLENAKKLDLRLQLRLPFCGETPTSKGLSLVDSNATKLSPPDNLTRPIALPSQVIKDLIEHSSKAINSVAPATIADHQDEEIDWDFLKELPYSFRREIERDLRDRGIVSKQSSPSKLRLKGRRFMQQLIPSQIGSSPKYISIVDKPIRSPSKRKPASSSLCSPSKKKESLPAYDDSGTLDSMVLDELPTFIRDEVVKEDKVKKLSKSLRHKPMKDKIEERVQDARVEFESIDSLWINMQSRFHGMPLFLNKETTLLGIRSSLDGWVKASLHQGGPHEDDVESVNSFLQTLASEGFQARSCLLVRYIIAAVKYNWALHHVLSRCIVLEGLQDWKRVVETIFRPTVEKFCRMRDLDDLRIAI